MALLNRTVDDSSETTDSALSVMGALLVIADVTDALSASDVVDVKSGRFDTRSVNDSVAVTDALAPVSVTRIALSDSVVVTDELSIVIDGMIRVNDVVSVSDNLVRQPILALFIANARALNESKVRIDFSAPMLINDALRRPGSYVFHNTSPGGAEVVPLVVAVPAGQLNPLYVEIDVTEHTNLATYTVALASTLRGAAEEASTGIPFEYQGIGVEPTLQLVLAISPTEVDVYFSEPIANNAAANDRTRYQWAGGISTIDVKRVSGNVVTLQTTAQLPGALYTLTVIGSSSFAVVLAQDDITVTDEASHGLDHTEPVGDDSVAVSDSVVTKRTRVYVASASDTAAVSDGITATPTFGLQLQTIFASARPSPPNSPEIQRSANDISWVSTNYSPAPNKIVRNGGRNPLTDTVILVGDNGLFLRSTDGGATWTLSTPFGTTPSIGAVWFGNGVWVVSYSDTGGSKLYYSTTDGASWTGPIDPDAGTGTGPTGTITAGYSDNFFDGRWAAGLGLHVGVGYKGSIWTSPDAITWTRRTAAGSYVGSFYGFRGVAWSQSQNLLVAVGDATNGECQTSPDGAAWTKRNFDTTLAFATVWDVAYSPTLDLWLAVGDGSSVGRIQTSPNGTTWTSRTPIVGSNECYSCTWDAKNGLFVVGGRFGQVQTSPDGTNWTSRSPANTGGTFIGSSSSSIFAVIGGGAAN